MDDITAFLAKNLGTVSGWTLVALALLGWWKGTPAFIDAWAKREGGIEERLQASMSATLERYDAQLREADRHHQICMDEQGVLRSRLGEQDLIIATQNRTIAAQTQTIIEMAEQIKGLHASNIQQQGELADRFRGRA